MTVSTIILAAGKGKRFKSNTLKQFHILNGKPLIYHSIEKAIKSKIFKEVIVVTNSKIKKPKDKISDFSISLTTQLFSFCNFAP